MMRFFNILFFTSVLCFGHEPITPFETSKEFRGDTQIDKIVLSQLISKGLKGSLRASDAVLIRRLYLDLTGALPNKEDVLAYINSKDKNKYERLVEELLNSESFATYITFRWSDVLKIKAEFPINLWPNAAQAYNKYIYDSLNENLSYTQITADLLKSSGSNFRVAPVNFYRALQGRGENLIAESACSFFLGIDYMKLPEETRLGLEKFFEKVAYKDTKEWKEEIVYFSPLDRSGFKTSFFGNKDVFVADMQDPREVFYELLIKHPLYARNFVNRVWGRLMGNYIIKNPDDTLNSKVLNQKLLDYLAKEFIKSGYDIKKLYSLVLNTATYKTSSIVSNKDIFATYENFGAYTPRQLEAEVLIDAICNITETSEIYSSMIPEPYTSLPTYRYALSIPDGSISTPFLELFGKSARDTGKEAERISQATTSQRLYLLNSTHIRLKIEQSPYINRLSRLDLIDGVNQLYLSVLSRYPSAGDKNFLSEYFNIDFTSTKNMKTKTNLYRLRNLLWALINTEEFLNKH